MSKFAIIVIASCLPRDGAPTRILPDANRHNRFIDQPGAPRSGKWKSLTRSPPPQALEDAMNPGSLTQGKGSRTDMDHTSNVSDGTASSGIYLENLTPYEVMVTLSVVQNYYWTRLRPGESHHFATGRVWMTVNVEAWVPGHSQEPKPWKEAVRGTFFWAGIAWSIFDLGATAAIAAGHGITAQLIKEFGKAAGHAFSALVTAVNQGFNPSASFMGVYMDDSTYWLNNDSNYFYLIQTMKRPPL